MPLFKNRNDQTHEDIALFTLETAEKIIHLPIERMITETIERIKDFFQTKHACIHFYPNFGISDEIANLGLSSCPLATVPPETQKRLLGVENELNLLAMRSKEIISHKDIFDSVAGWNEFNEYFEFKDGVTIPLFYQDEVFGALDIYHSTPTRLTLEDVRYLNALGSCLYGAVKKEVLIRELLDRDDLIEAFAKTVEAADNYTGGHIDRVMTYALRLGIAVGLDNNELKALKRAALLHDIGKIGIPKDILNKPGPLTDEERTVIETHPVIAEQIFHDVKEGLLKQSMDGIVYHHERIDGKGYPRGLSDTEIPLIARVIAVADTFDALTSDRPYRRGMSTFDALKILQEIRGRQLDTRLVDIFIDQELYKNEGEPPLKQAG